MTETNDNQTETQKKSRCIACGDLMPTTTEGYPFCDSCDDLSHYERRSLVYLNQQTMLLVDLWRCLKEASAGHLETVFEAKVL